MVADCVGILGVFCVSEMWSDCCRIVKESAKSRGGGVASQVGNPVGGGQKKRRNPCRSPGIGRSVGRNPSAVGQPGIGGMVVGMVGGQAGIRSRDPPTYGHKKRGALPLFLIVIVRRLVFYTLLRGHIRRESQLRQSFVYIHTSL